MIQLVDGKKHQIIKRDGRSEEYNPEKMYKVLLWACNNSEHLAKEILKDIDIKVFDKLSIVKLFNEVIECAANKISEMYPIWDIVARNLYLQKIYKETWGIKRNEYPHYADVLDKGIQYNIYNKKILESFTEEEIQALNGFIVPDRDKLFTFGGLNLFMQKYASNYTKTKKLELPQHAMMRVAIQLHYNDKNRLQNIKEKYDAISKHEIVIPTPMYLNALKDIFNPTSCVLIQPDDDSESIIDTGRSMAIYSKNGSGLGIDITRIRSVGSLIGKDGVSSGVVPFVQVYESIVKAWNQKSARVGSAAIYYPWWHMQSPEIIMLKDAGGQDSERARALKYSIKWNNYLTKAAIRDEEVYLFDPKEVPDLIEAANEDFDEIYKMYVEKADRNTLKKRKILARELVFLYLKVYAETGINYWMSVDNANKFRVASGHINMSNLCGEILLSTKPLNMLKNKIQTNYNNKYIIEKRDYNGEIGICNLTNINLIAWDTLSEEDKNNLAYSILVGMDNAIENGSYPVKAGEKFNRLHRALGIGITNYQNWLASQGIKLSDEAALEKTHEIMESVAYYLTKNSIELAKERGRYHYFEGSLWSKGKFQHDLYREHFDEVAPELNFEYKYDWDGLREDMMKYGVRFENLMATAPGATSSLALSFTESAEPIRAFKINKEGTYTLPFLAPNLIKNRPYYETCWQVDNKTLIRLAAVRQKFVDQSQSTNIYFEKIDSAFELLEVIMLAEKLGVKTLYYLNAAKAGEAEAPCENCSV
jgi:ribonucleoside-diphosphate reductase alpha chain